MENAFTGMSLFRFISHVFFNKTNVNTAQKVTRPAEILFMIRRVDVIKWGRKINVLPTNSMEENMYLY